MVPYEKLMRSLYGLQVKYTNMQRGEDSRLCGSIEPVNFTLGMVVMIDVTEAAGSNEALVLKLVRSMETGALPESIKAWCTEGFVWANSGLALINGQAEFFEQMARGGFANQIPILNTMTHFSAELIHIASKGNIVFTERVDHHWDEQGRDLMTPHICGVAEIQDGKISAFRDFYDVACYRQAPTEVQKGFDLGSFKEAQSNGTR